MSEDQREAYVRAAFAAVAEEMIEFGTTKTGLVMIQFQNGVPRSTEWRLKGESVSRVLTRTPDP